MKHLRKQGENPDRVVAKAAENLASWQALTPAERKSIPWPPVEAER